MSLLAAFCTGLVVSAPLVSFIDPDVLPQGKEVFGAGPRIAAAVASGVGAMVIFGGALWSAWRLLRGRRRAGAPSTVPAGRLALANLFIAAGTLVLSAGGLLNSVVDEMDGFAISLVVGISIIFVGFLLTNSGGGASVRSLAEPRAWHARPAQVAAAVVVAVGLIGAPLVLDHRPAAAASGDVGDYLGRINATRSAAGVAPLVLDSELSGLAQAWAQQLADWQRLQHASDLSVGVTQPWKKLGENVGRGGSTASIYPAFVASPTHYANIVDPTFTRVGIGVVVRPRRQAVHRAALPRPSRRRRRWRSAAAAARRAAVASSAAARGGGGSSGGGSAPTTTTTEPPSPAASHRAPATRPTPPSCWMPFSATSAEPTHGDDVGTSTPSSPPVTPAIETEGLTRGFKSGLAVDGLTFTLEPGEVLALLGPNGAGKTTTVRLLDGVLLPRRRALDRCSASTPRPRATPCAAAPGCSPRTPASTTGSPPARTCSTSPASGASARPTPCKRVDELLERFGMAERRRRPHQRLLDRPAQAGRPGPGAAARPRAAVPRRADLRASTRPAPATSSTLIDELAAEGRTIVLATHFLGEAGRLADRMAVLHRGRLRAFGAPDDLAAELWSGIGAELDLGAPGRRRHRWRASSVVPGVRSVERPRRRRPPACSTTATSSPGRSPPLVGRGVPVYGAASPQAHASRTCTSPSSAASPSEEGELGTDGFTSPRPPGRSTPGAGASPPTAPGSTAGPETADARRPRPPGRRGRLVSAAGHAATGWRSARSCGKDITRRAPRRRRSPCR